MMVAIMIATLLALGAGALLTLGGVVHAVVGSPTGTRLALVGPAASLAIAALGLWLFVNSFIALLAFATT